MGPGVSRSSVARCVAFGTREWPRCLDPGLHSTSAFTAYQARLHRPGTRSPAKRSPRDPGRALVREESATENKMKPGRIAIAATTFACAALLSFGWSGQHGVSLSVESAQAKAQARENHVTPRHAAVAPRGQMRRHVARAYARG